MSKLAVVPEDGVFSGMMAPVKYAGYDITNVKKVDVAGMYRRAAGEILTYGWHQGSYFVNEYWDAWMEDIPQACPSCALGALLRATGCLKYSAASDRTEFIAAEKYFYDQTGFPSFAQFNDAEDQTKEAVVNTLLSLANGLDPE